MSHDNVTEEQLVAYIKTFHRILEKRASKLPEVIRNELKHISLLPAKIICYVSTQFGVGFEYIPADAGSVNFEVEVVRSSKRIEEMILGTPRRLSKTTPFIAMGGRGFGLTGCNIAGTFPFRIINESDYLTVTDTDFTVQEWKRHIYYAEIYGSRKASEWTEDMAIDRAVDEVETAQAELNMAKTLNMSVPEFIKHSAQKGVLILGSYSEEGLKKLCTIKEKIKEMGYTPILVKDIELSGSLHRKVKTLGNLMRFIIVEDSEKSGHLTEIEFCKQDDWITAFLWKDGRPSSAMTKDYTVGTLIRRGFDYELPLLDAALENAVSWAEDTLLNVSENTKKPSIWNQKFLE